MNYRKKILDETLEINEIVANTFEHMNLSKDQIESILNNDFKHIDISKSDIRTIYQFNECFNYVLCNDKKLSFEDIKTLHWVLGYKLAIDSGEFRQSSNAVGGRDNSRIIIFPKDENKAKEEFNQLIKKLDSSNSEDLNNSLIIDFMIEQITDQWFWDCNKRISIITANKLLKDYSKGNNISLLTKFDSKTFDELLANYYEAKYLFKGNVLDTKLKLNRFLINSINKIDKISIQSSLKNILKEYLFLKDIQKISELSDYVNNKLDNIFIDLFN